MDEVFSKVKKWRLLILIEAVLIGFYLASRLTNLTLLPIFTDEAIYLHWAQVARGDPSWRFISLTDGKQPLFIWLTMLLIRSFADPLSAGRFVSVLAGLLSMIGLFFVGKVVFKDEKVGLWASFLYLLCPFCLWFDRMALMDALLACFAVWGLLFEALLVKTLRLDIALILGGIIGGGLLTKSSAQFFLYLLPFSLLLLNFKKLDLFSKIIKISKWMGLAVISTFIAEGIKAIQRLSPFYHMIGLKNLAFVVSFKDFITTPIFKIFERVYWNSHGLLGWTWQFLTPSIIFLIVLSFFLERKKFLREKIFLFMWFLIPFASLASFGIVLYPRFLLFMTMLLLVLAAFSLEQIRLKIKNNFLFFIFYFLFFIYPLYFDSQIIFNPVNAPLPQASRGQYLDDWPAGFGIKETVAFLKKESVDKKIAIGTEGTFGLTPYALIIYLQGDTNIEIRGFWPVTASFEWLTEKAREKPTYLLLKDTQKPDEAWLIKLELVEKYRRGKGETHLGLYRVVDSGN